MTARGWRAPTRRLSPGVRPPCAGASGGLTAAELVNTWEPREIARVLWEYGEERDSRRLARAIVAARPLQTTAQLAACLKAAAPPGPPKAATKAAARVFQALRIAVNGELEQLDGLLCARPRPPLEPPAGAEAGTRGPKPAGVVGIRQTGHETGLALPLPLAPTSAPPPHSSPLVARPQRRRRRARAAGWAAVRAVVPLARGPARQAAAALRPAGWRLAAPGCVRQLALGLDTLDAAARHGD